MLPLRIVSAARGKGAVPIFGRIRAQHRGVGASLRRASLAFSLLAGIFSACSAAFLGTSAARAADADSSMVAVPTAPLDLDGLFSKLKQAPDAESAAVTSRAIQQRWSHSGSDTADLLMQRADAALAGGDRPLAIEILDRLIAIDPDWAEAWNRRATIFFLEDDLSRSAADIQEVLAREPRHFGALMGLAGILERIGDDHKALEAYEKVLDVYPLLPSAQKAVERLKAHFNEVPI
ncbi:MAG: tetratricopeptide repeat protein [Hyphomicrobiales bacterium]|nr:tetratricopeptide repeat protein [Hyphomicrobiales bacterium]MBV9136677.1 tetratricopeptide repeat protein [Hyphomicrobiales bacterium]